MSTSTQRGLPPALFTAVLASAVVAGHVPNPTTDLGVCSSAGLAPPPNFFGNTKHKMVPTLGSAGIVQEHGNLLARHVLSIIHTLPRWQMMLLKQRKTISIARTLVSTNPLVNRGIAPGGRELRAMLITRWGICACLIGLFGGIHSRTTTNVTCLQTHV